MAIAAPARDVRSGAGRRAQRVRSALTGAGFLAPFFIPFALFFVLPIGYAIYLSTLSTTRTGGVFGTVSTQFAGFGQYLAVITDSDFTGGLVRVLVFACFQVPIMIIISTLLALLL